MDETASGGSSNDGVPTQNVDHAVPECAALVLTCTSESRLYELFVRLVVVGNNLVASTRLQSLRAVYDQALQELLLNDRVLIATFEEPKPEFECHLVPFRNFLQHLEELLGAGEELDEGICDEDSDAEFLAMFGADAFMIFHVLKNKVAQNHLSILFTNDDGQSF